MIPSSAAAQPSKLELAVLDLPSDSEGGCRLGYRGRTCLPIRSYLEAMAAVTGAPGF